MAEVGVYPVPEGVGCVVVFGGTFDPPHRAHFELPLAARDAIGAGWLLYVPAGRSPLKEENPVASDEDRVAMLRAGLAGEGRASVSTVELEGEEGEGRRAASYTVETLEELGRRAGASTRLRLLIGSDQAASFHRWREPRRIIELAEPVVMLRSPQETRESLARALEGHWSREEVERWMGRVVELPVVDVSATRVRELLRGGRLDDRELRDALPGGVLEHIRSRGLYVGA